MLGMFGRINLNDVCDKHAPLKEKRIKGHLPEWINGDYIKLTKDRDHFFSKAHKTNDPEDWKMAKSLRNKVNNLNRHLKKKYCTDAIKENVNNSTKLWKTIKKLIPRNNASVRSVQTDDGFTTCNKDIANEFNSFFTSIGITLAQKFDNVNNSDDDSCKNVTNDECNNDDVSGNFNFGFVTPSFVFDEICNFSNKKSSGLDNFNVELLKLSAPIICDSLAYICNLSLYTSIFPSDWKLAKVTPIYKEGDKSDVSNYRPISVLCIISKILERAVHDQLYSYLSKQGILHPSQSGFRSNHSTTTTLLDTSDYILKNMNDRKLTGAIFLDLKKAFDTINHSLLINKLKQCGISGSCLKWFISYLSNRSQAVNISSTMSDFKDVNIGIPQGSILGPLLFIIFVNSLPNSVNCKTIMYADDTTLICSSNDAATLQAELNGNLSNVASWLNENNLTLNIKKTKLMIFGTTYMLNTFDDIDVSYNGNNIERVDKFKYLGVVFDQLLSWHEHVDHLSSNISKRIGIIRRLKYYLPNDTLKMLANALVMPHFDYCSPVWTNCINTLSTSLQVHHNRLARILLSADIRTPINDMMDSLNWDKLHTRWEKQLLIIVFKCLTHNAPSYLFSQFSYMQSLHTHGTRSQTFNSLVMPKWNINPGKRTFHYRSCYAWNKLPQDIRGNFPSMTVHTFKNCISKL